MTPENAIRIALQHFNSGRFSESEILCHQVLAKAPNHLDALHLQSLLEATANRVDAAIQLISRAISINPNVPDYYVNLAEFQRRVGQFDLAIAGLQHAIHLQPTNPIAHYNLGVVLAEQRRPDEAFTEYRRAVALNPSLVEAQVRLGNELRRRRCFDESTTAFRAAIKARPDSREAHWNYSLLLLQTGDWDAGWREYEWRRQIESICPPRNFLQPEWTGESLNGQTVFLHIEQAFGDILQFVRFASKVAERGGRAFLQSPPELVRVLHTLRGVDQIIPANGPVPQFDLHCPLLSLPRVFSTRPDWIPCEVPYLHPDQQLVERWRSRIEPHDGKFKVGLSWAGRQMLMDGRDRSIPLALLGPLAEAKEAVFFTVQPHNPGVESLPLGMELVDWSADLRDFADTAALMTSLDLVISIDTAAAHLAGALGRSVWTLLLHNADWRWLLDREDSPWYPTMRLFRQPAEGDWQPVIQMVAEKLRIKAASNG